jgi:hypothetical protein
LSLNAADGSSKRTALWLSYSAAVEDSFVRTVRSSHEAAVVCPYSHTIRTTISASVRATNRTAKQPAKWTSYCTALAASVVAADR